MSCPAPLPLLSVRRPGLGSRAKEGSFYCLQSWVCLAALPPSVNLLNPKGRAGEGGQDTPGARCCAQSWLCSSAPRIPATSTAEGCEALGSSKQSRGTAGKGRSPFPQGFPVPPCLHEGMLKFPGSYVSSKWAGKLPERKADRARPILPSKPFCKFFAGDVSPGGSDLDGTKSFCSCRKVRNQRGGERGSGLEGGRETQAQKGAKGEGENGNVMLDRWIEGERLELRKAGEQPQPLPSPIME